EAGHLLRDQPGDEPPQVRRRRPPHARTPVPAGSRPAPRAQPGRSPPGPAAGGCGSPGRPPRRAAGAAPACRFRIVSRFPVERNSLADLIMSGRRVSAHSTLQSARPAFSGPNASVLAAWGRYMLKRTGLLAVAMLGAGSLL